MRLVGYDNEPNTMYSQHKWAFVSLPKGKITLVTLVRPEHNSYCARLGLRVTPGKRP